MRVFGYSVPIILLLAIAFVLGAKNPGVIARLPLIGSK